MVPPSRQRARSVAKSDAVLLNIGRGSRRSQLRAILVHEARGATEHRAYRRENPVIFSVRIEKGEFVLGGEG